MEICVISTLCADWQVPSDTCSVICNVHCWNDTENLRYYSMLITYSMEQRPFWEANRFLASQEIPRILWNPKVHYCTHKCPPPVPILSQIGPVRTPTSHFLKNHLNIFLPSMSGSSKWSLPQVSHPNPLYASTLPHTCYIPRPSHSRFYHLNNIRWGVQIIRLLIM